MYKILSEYFKSSNLDKKICSPTILSILQKNECKYCFCQCSKNKF